ncbi:DUF5658 family protein [Alteribacter natronophilus]|uniref:DUF5658 family protein n=1 Tax=Alteribacter natronophilus TaxID=2583810 RepID=UPI00110D7598|nr:DUF5658 family protein [Alteribacter natronophilus]TMW71126.1 hypothetical protein FGB90_14275 [Alteribacter natronophilus]
MPVKRLMAAIAVLNLTDALITVTGLHFGLIGEANPLMARLWSASPILFTGVKLLLSTAVVLFLPHISSPVSRIVTVLTVLAFLGYTFVHVLHLTWLTVWIMN